MALQMTDTIEIGSRVRDSAGNLGTVLAITIDGPALVKWDGPDDFETPESDPAERDPEEAEPATGANIRSTRGAKLRGIVVARIPNVYGSRPGYSVFWEDGTVSVIGDGFELGVCPIHGAGCEAWS